LSLLAGGKSSASAGQLWTLRGRKYLPVVSGFGRAKLTIASEPLARVVGRRLASLLACTLKYWTPFHPGGQTISQQLMVRCEGYCWSDAVAISSTFVEVLELRLAKSFLGLLLHIRMLPPVQANDLVGRVQSPTLKTPNERMRERW
jgi:hypothetical protein